jgi:hypothetical protein
MSVRGNCIAVRHTDRRGQRPYELLTCSSADLPLLRAGPLRSGGRVLAIYGPAPGACRRKLRPRAGSAATADRRRFDGVSADQLILHVAVVTPRPADPGFR